ALLLSSLARQPPSPLFPYTTLFRSTISSGIAQATFPYVGWGTGFVDFTNSGWSDILIANGHIYPQIDQGHMGFTYRQPMLLFHKIGRAPSELQSLAYLVCRLLLEKK